MSEKEEYASAMNKVYIKKLISKNNELIAAYSEIHELKLGRWMLALCSFIFGLGIGELLPIEFNL
ncbi:MAG: hypothetical protein ACRC0J_16455 [Shewanella oncorhynchi]